MEAIEQRIDDRIWQLENAEEAKIPSTREEVGVIEELGQKRRKR